MTARKLRHALALTNSLMLVQFLGAEELSLEDLVDQRGDALAILHGENVLAENTN